MSIVRIRRKMGAGMKYLLGAILIIFAAGIFISFGPGMRGPGQGRPQTGGPAVVATVNGKAISRPVFDMRLSRAQGRFASQRLAQDRQSKLMVLEQFISEALMSDAIRQHRIKASREEIEQAIEQNVQMRLAQLFPGPEGGVSKRALKNYLDQQNVTYEDYMAQLRAEQEGYRDFIVRDLQEQKLRTKIQESVEVTEEDLKESHKQVKARHILIAPEEAAADKPEEAQRAAAKQEAEKLLAQLKGGADFAKLAKEHSDDETSRDQGGLLEQELKRDQVFTEFLAWSRHAAELLQQPQGWTRLRREARKISDQLFATPKGSLTGVIATLAGFHIFKVEDVKTELPEDFEKNKKQLLDGYRRSKQFEAWADFEDELRQSAEIVVQDAELKAYQAMDQGDYEAAYALLEEALKYTREREYPEDPAELPVPAKVKLQEARRAALKHMKARDFQAAHAEFSKALKYGRTFAGDPAVNYQLGQVAEELGKTKRAVAHYLEAEEGAAGSPDLHLALGEVYRQHDRRRQALAQFQEAHEAAETIAPENRAVHLNLKDIYDQMGEKELAAQQQAWLDELDKELEASRPAPPA